MYNPCWTYAALTLGLLISVNTWQNFDILDISGALILRSHLDIITVCAVLYPISTDLGIPRVTFISPLPAKWKVLRVIWVEGSPILWAASSPTASPGSHNALCHFRCNRCLNLECTQTHAQNDVGINSYALFSNVFANFSDGQLLEICKEHPTSHCQRIQTKGEIPAGCWTDWGRTRWWIRTSRRRNRNRCQAGT